MLVAFVFVAVLLLVATVLICENENKKRVDKAVEQMRSSVELAKRQWRDDVADLMSKVHAEVKKAIEENENSLDALLIAIKKDFDALNIKAIRSEIEVLTTRQRTLEKNIIRNERTINLNIIPPTGKGRGSLLKTAGLT